MMLPVEVVEMMELDIERELKLKWYSNSTFVLAPECDCLLQRHYSLCTYEPQVLERCAV